MGRGNRGNASDEGTQSSGEDEPTQQKKTTKLPRPEGKYPCPRCASENTKFCYYNNYNIKQPRFYCKACQRYWTVGGTLRNLPPGSGKRKSKSAKGGDFEKPSSSNFDGTPPATNTSTSMFLHSQNTTNQLAALAAAQVNSGLLQDHTSVLNMQAAAAQQQLLSDPALNALKNMQAQGLAGWGDLGLLGGAGQVEARALLGLGNYDNSGGAGVAAQLQQAHGVQQQQLLMQQFGLDDGDVHGRRVRPKQDPDANAPLSPLSMGLGSNGALNGLQSDGKDVHIKPSASPTSSLLQQHQQAALLQHQHQQQQQAALLQHHIMNEQLQRNALLQQQQQHAALLGVSPWLGGGLGGAGGLGVDLMGANGAALLAQGTSGLELMGAKNAMSNVAAMQLAGAQAQAQNTAAAQLMAAQQGGLWAVNGLGVWPNAAATTLYGNAAMYGQVPGRGL